MLCWTIAAVPLPGGVRQVESPKSLAAPERIDRGRFTVVFYPGERLLAGALLDRAMANDTFPGLPRPADRVLLAIAPDRARFREWVGRQAPEWGAAIAFPESHRIVMQGRSAGSDAGDPVEVLRHELAHLALHEALGDAPPQWFDEGYASYAAREWSREDVLAVNVALAIRGTPTFDGLDELFGGGSQSAQTAYALAYRAVVELASLDPEHGLSRFIAEWRRLGSMDRAMRSAYGITLDGFEKRWQERTRQRYGVLSFLGSVAVVGLVTVLLVFPLYSARRERDRRRMAQLVAADEAAARAGESSAIDEMLKGDDESGPSREPAGGPPS